MKIIIIYFVLLRCFNKLWFVLEYEEKESSGTIKWKEAVENCQTYSRLHVLVGIFDSCIKWEKSMATLVILLNFILSMATLVILLNFSLF